MSRIDLMDLWSKSTDYKFNKEEIEFILKKITPSSFYKLKVKYAFYRPDSSKGLYIVLIYDTTADASRRSGVENKWEVICERNYSELELLEYAQNFGCQKQRFKVYNYKYIECLQFDDAKYNIQTPEAFIKEAIKRGYTNPNFDLIKWERSFKKNVEFSNEPKQLILF